MGAQILLILFCTLLLPLLVAAKRCKVGNTTGEWRLKLENEAVLFEGQTHIWRQDTQCSWSIEGRQDLLTKFRGKRIAFIGDSTTRLQTYEILMWAWGCDKVDEVTWKERFVNWPFLRHGADDTTETVHYGSIEDVCHDTKVGQRWDKTSQDFVVPTGRDPSPRDITIQFRWTTFLYDVIDRIKQLFEAPPEQWPDVVFLNSGFWYLRYYPDLFPHGDSEFLGYWASLDALIAYLSNGLPPEVDAKKRFVWRGLNTVTMQDGRFNNDNIRAMDNGTQFKWSGAGFPFVGIQHYTPASSPREGKPEIVFTEEGYHPRRWVYRQIIKEVLQAGINALKSRGKVIPNDHDNDDVDEEFAAAEQGQAGQTEAESEGETASNTPSGTSTPVTTLSTTPSITSTATPSSSFSNNPTQSVSPSVLPPSPSPSASASPSVSMPSSPASTPSASGSPSPTVSSSNSSKPSSTASASASGSVSASIVPSSSSSASATHEKSVEIIDAEGSVGGSAASSRQKQGAGGVDHSFLPALASDGAPTMLGFVLICVAVVSVFGFAIRALNRVHVVHRARRDGAAATAVGDDGGDDNDDDDEEEGAGTGQSEAEAAAADDDEMELDGEEDGAAEEQAAMLGRHHDEQQP